MTLELTELEANELIKLLDLAVKFQGLQVAESAAVFFNKLKLAHKEISMKNIDIKVEETPQ